MAHNLESLIDVSRIVDLKARTKDEALRELVAVMASSPNIGDSEALLAKIIEREKTTSTGVGIGVALPHVKIPSVKDFVLAIGRCQRGIDFQSLDDQPVRIIVMIAANESQSSEFLKLMAKIVLRLKDKEFRNQVLLAASPRDIRDLFLRSEVDS